MVLQLLEPETTSTFDTKRTPPADIPGSSLSSSDRAIRPEAPASSTASRRLVFNFDQEDLFDQSRALVLVERQSKDRPLDDEAIAFDKERAGSDMASRLAFRLPPHEESLRKMEDSLNTLRSRVPRGVINNSSELDQFINNVYTLFRQHADSIQFVTGCHNLPGGYASYAAIVAQNPQRPEAMTVLAKGRAFRPGDVNGYTFYNYAEDDRGARYDARFRDLRQVIDEIMHDAVVKAETGHGVRHERPHLNGTQSDSGRR